MASSSVMASTSPPNPDLPRQSAASSSSSSLLTQTTPSTFLPPPPPAAVNHHLHQADQSITSPFGSMNMEEILKNIYSEPDSLSSAVDGGGSIPDVVPTVDAACGTNKTSYEVWREINNGGGGGGSSREPKMTLEDFLTKAGAVSEEDVRASTPAPPPVPVPAPSGYIVEQMMNVQFPVAPGPVVHMQNGPGPGGFGLESQLGYGNGMVASASVVALGGAAGGANGSAVGRGKRRAVPVEEVALDQATQQKQKRMIKNRESAARSRERKQAYTVELESLVTQLEDENARLLREEAEQTRARYRQLMENLVPVVERQRSPPRRVLGRQNSW